MDSFVIARVGKTVGLKGQLRLHLMTDFTEQFHSGAVFDSDKGKLEISSYYPNKNTVLFKGYEDIDSAKPLTNVYLYSDEQKTRQACKLQEGEMFWFDMIGLEVIEDGAVLGSVSDIDRIGGIEYFRVQTAHKYAGYAKSFLVPNIKEYVLGKDKNGICTSGALGILEES